MTETQKALCLCAVSLGSWTLLSLLLSRTGERALRRTLAVLVALLLLPPLNAYVLLLRGEAWAPLAVWSHCLTWAYGPLLLRSLGLALLWPTGAWDRAWHLLPAALALAAGAAGLDWAKSPLLAALLALQTLGYGAFVARSSWRQRVRLRQLARGHRNSRAHWLLFLAGGLVAASVWDLAVFAAIKLGHLPPAGLLLGSALGMAVYVDAIALLALHPPAWLDAEPATEPTPEHTPEPAPPRVVELSPDAVRDLAARLEQLMQRHGPHRDPDISLPRLAALMDITPHQLSELLNLHLGSSFYDYLNDRRHADALQMLAQGSAELTVADIAYRAGFNNRNSFYKVFKQKTGLTPADYRRQYQRRA
ncbi:helix-turn-helix domain-containing protein [Roseateles paludis]|uniref:AraC family transcriptional regulator n=1 Tax=Roseateles paludis TaxID=3145238 RepID=A0ABV0G4S0_9BURK